MSFLSRLFGLGGEERKETVAAEPITYNGFTIIADPQEDDGQWRVAGRISKMADGDFIERPFIRADLCMSRDEAIEATHRKARQIIDQNPRIFDDPSETGPV